MSNGRNKIDPNQVSKFEKEKLKAVQLDLQTKGHYKGKIDGIYGPATKKAIESYNLNQIVAERVLPEVEISAPRRHKLKGCVQGVCFDLADKNEMPEEKLRKSNNLYGDAWNLLNNAYGDEIPIDDGNYSNLKVNDIVSLSRGSFKTDKERGIPESNQHVGRVSKIENGVPYIRHYISNIGKDSKGEPYGEFIEEPINNIKKFAKYTPTRAKRLSDFKDITIGEPRLEFDAPYKPNQIEKDFKKGVQDKARLQKVLGLDDNEFDELTKVAYGIMGAESSFGRSGRTLYRMAVPDFIQKGVKLAHDEWRGVDVYDDNVNNLSQGYSSTKESSLHGISANDGSNNYVELNKRIKSGDYGGIERTNNYLYYKMQELGLNPDNLESGDASYKAILANLSWIKKRNPNATEDDLIKAYTGKKDIASYKKRYEAYKKNVDDESKYDYKYTSKKDDLLGYLSNKANELNTTAKELTSKGLGVLRDYSPLPENVNQLLYDVAGGKEQFTEKAMSAETQKALANIVKKKLTEGSTTIGYADYGTSQDKNEDVGGGKSPGIGKMINDPNYILKTMLGQASIVQEADGSVYVTDTYDFNDKGKSFGITDDLSKRGFSPYSLVRSIGRNYGSQDGQGSPVKIKVNLENQEMKNKKGYFAGGDITSIASLATSLAGSYADAFNYKADPTGDPYKFNLAKGLQGGLISLAPELIKMYKDKNARENYIASATPGRYSKGGEIDEQLSSLAFEVEADPNKVDSKYYPNLNVNLDHGEVVMNNKFVFSNRIDNPKTGKSFAEEAEALQKSVGKAEKILKTNPRDAFANNTINISNDRTKKLAQTQEALASLLGHRDNKPQGMATGGFTGGPGDPPDRRNLVPLNNKVEEGYKFYYDKSTGKTIKLRESLPKTYNEPQPYQLTTTSDIPSMSNSVEEQKGQYVHLRGDYYIDPTDRSFMWRNPLTGSYKKESGMPGFSSGKGFRPYFKFEGDSIIPLSTTTNDRDGSPIGLPPLARVTTTQGTGNIDPLNPFGVLDQMGQLPVATETTPSKPRGTSRAGKKVPTNNLPTTTTSPLDGQVEYDRAMYEEMQAAANRNLPVPAPPTSVKSTAAERGLPDLGALTSSVAAATTVPSDGRIYNKFTLGDALQAVEVASKFGQLIGGPDKEMPNFDTTRITKETFDPTNAKYQTNRTLQNAINTIEAPSVNMRRNIANSLYAQRLGQDNNIMSEYNRMNQAANTQYEQRAAAQRQYNIGQTNYTEDLNQRNLDTYRNTVQNAFTSLGNFGEALNSKRQGTDALNILRKSYPQVYQRMMEDFIKKG